MLILESADCLFVAQSSVFSTIHVSKAWNLPKFFNNYMH